MQKIFNRTTVTILIFTIGILLAFLSPYFPETKILFQMLLAISFVYLIFDWYLFKAYYPEGHPLILFVMGYFYAGVFIGSVFAMAKWPFAKTLIATSLFWTVA